MVSLFERKQKVAKSAAEVVKAARSEDKITAPELIKGMNWSYSHWPMP